MLNIVTIIAKNYLAQARVLTASFKKYNPDGKVFVFVVDDIGSYFDPKDEDFIYISCDELQSDIRNFEGFRFQYTILELCTALKPYALRYLFKKFNLKNIAYFDPDILITASLKPLIELLDQHTFILTPHITQPYTDDLQPTEINHLRTGTYNLGFIAMVNNKTSMSMLEWWAERLYKNSRDAVSEGLFTDQKWIDLIPGFFPGTFISRDPGLNVAYWNLHERVIKIEDEMVTCNDLPLLFFHFSGYSLDKPTIVSKYQNRHNFEQIGDAKKLFTRYSELLLDNGYTQCQLWPYTFAEFDNGIKIPDLARKIYWRLTNPDFFGNPFKTSGTNSFFQWLTSEKENEVSLFTAIYREKLELQLAFPNLAGHDRYNFFSWILTEGVTQYNLDKRLLNNINSNCFAKQMASNQYDQSLGVNVAGHFNSEKGVGEVARSNLRCLDKTTYTYVLNNVIDPDSRNFELTDAKLSLDNPYRINLIHINADQLPGFVQAKGSDYFKNRYNIGHWEWELSEFPKEWWNAFQYLDEIWVSSHFIQESIAEISPIPVFTVPPALKNGIDEEPCCDREFFNIPKDAFVFLFMFDFASFMARKNPQAIIKSFLHAFSAQDNAVLVIKTSHANFHEDEFRQLVDLAATANVIIFDKVLSAKQVRSLMMHADCYVSLHRCEGFGLTLFEAMSLAKPVIATAYSGNTDYMNAKNSFLVDYKLVEIDQDYGPYKKGYLWAEPDLSQAANLMRYVYEHQEEAKAIGQLASKFLLNNFSVEQISKIYQRRLDAIENRLSNEDFYKQKNFSKLERNVNFNSLQNILCGDEIWKISSHSNKILVASLVKLYKRFVRKSIFWILSPLMVKLREFQHHNLALQKKIVGDQGNLQAGFELYQSKVLALESAVKDLQEKMNNAQE